ncbi:unnamed protein product [Triticum turgidum subsp. durum]|uniref:Uncharacterized protein n=1 Tax=Triticum turgidum subsp. durum TaxID=4567 RepID=A0A9R1BY82_TRITD|nr:unnamed protein product [Triticum turgidum subsp. durum]
MSHYQEHNVEDMEDDYDMDDPVDDMDGEDYLGPEARDDSDEEDDEDAEANKASDTSSEEARRGKDIQGIPWDRLELTREGYRETRLLQYKNYENIPNSAETAMKACKSTEKDGTYYEFRRNTRSVKSTILHFQVKKFSMGYI